jgi:serine/threonine protein kinase
VQSFFREIGIHKDLNHPYVVRVYGVPIDRSVDPPKVGILMERMHCSLSDAPKNAARPFPLRERVTVLSQVAAGLVFLHGRKPHAIIHADLKAMNVLLADTAKGYQAKLADFGLAALKMQVKAHNMAAGGAGAAPGGRDTSVGGGTLPFMAPELFEGGSHSARSDTYAFGIMMWEVLAGKFPYEGDPRRAGVRDQRAYIAFLKTHSPDMTQIDARTPRRVRALMERCWHKEVSRRPLMTEVFEELERAIQESPDPRGGSAAGGMPMPPAPRPPAAPTPVAAPVPLPMPGAPRPRAPLPAPRVPLQPPPPLPRATPANHTAADRGECSVM